MGIIGYVVQDIFAFVEQDNLVNHAIFLCSAGMRGLAVSHFPNNVTRTGILNPRIVNHFVARALADRMDADFGGGDEGKPTALLGVIADLSNSSQKSGRSYIGFLDKREGTAIEPR